MWHKVSSCPVCGAPIYVSEEFDRERSGFTCGDIPINHFTCECVKKKPKEAENE